ncbi:DUF58 domain-containing protein [Leptolyngbya sp. FACHB-541]|uniref:DUF58 domain-containing protein n=1 Tax=Leptolyngbya sp. FACHB-541 TaxID=2692810 RepID=UPI0016839EB5|nr:DUF58 domain-containing protein [Leptolyngbya sp. FACHB-541]MBD1998088.1 DUF58 domain-containing protein [Leptolyngbya sp. FACHB-541]
MIPAPRVYQLLLLGTGVGLGLAAFGSGNTRPALLLVALGLTLTWDVLVLGLAFWDSRQVKSSPVKVSRESLQRLSIGQENPVRLTVKSSDRPATLQIRDFYPPEFTATPPLLELTLPPDREEELTYTVFPAKRGEYLFGNIQVRQLGAWGLAWHSWRIPQPQTVAVYPDLLGLRSLSLRLSLQNSGNIRRAKRLGMGTEFAELREYSTGDDPRLIDWKATARRSRLLLRVLEPEQEQTLMILLDRGRLMTAQVKGLARFDWGLNAALSLALAGLNRGDRVGIGVFDRQMQVWVPPERGQTQLTKLIERLTPIHPVLLEPDYLGAITHITSQHTRRALVVLITDLVDKTASSELLLSMGRLAPRYLPFCVTLRDPQIDMQAHTLTQNIPSTYARAVALDLLAQRQVALATLKQRGVLILDAPANQITEQLVDRYLQLKARSQL